MSIYAASAIAEDTTAERGISAGPILWESGNDTGVRLAYDGASTREMIITRDGHGGALLIDITFALMATAVVRAHRDDALVAKVTTGEDGSVLIQAAYRPDRFGIAPNLATALVRLAFVHLA